MFAVGSYWPSQDGVAHITEYLAEGLAAKGHEVFVLTSTGNGGLQDLPKYEANKGVNITRMRIYVQWPLYLKGRDSFSTKKNYLKQIKGYSPDILVVVCTQTWTFDWIASELDELTCKKIFYSHGYSSMKADSDFWGKLKKRNILGAYGEIKRKYYYKNLYKYLKKFDLLLYLSEYNNSYAYGKEHGLNNFLIMENAIESRFFENEMVHTYEPKEKITFLCVANYNENKNQEMILKAFCNANIPNGRMWFSGFEENPYLEKLRNCLEEWLPKDSKKEVRFQVHLSREEIYGLYKEADIYVCGSKLENSPIVHREAGVTGMPIISTCVGDVQGIDGIVLVDDVETMEREMESFGTNEKFRREHGEKVRSYILSRKCSIQDKIDLLEKEMLNLMK